MSHTYEFTVGFMMPLSRGARIIYAGKPPTPSILAKICAAEKPSVICVVPMVMEKIYKKRVLGAINDSRMLRMGTKFSWTRGLIMAKIGRKLLDFFGGNLKLVAIGGAALNLETERFLREAKFPYLVGYGLTETAPILAGGPYGDETISLGSVGKIIPDVQVKIVNADPENGIGEIYAKGANVTKGYYKNPEATAESLDSEGWFATGDLGFFDTANNLHIKGRSKSVIVLAHGENIYPEAIEEKINAYVQVVESLVLENNGVLEARVYLDYDLVDRECSAEADGRCGFITEVLTTIKREVNQELPAYARLKDVKERAEPFVKTATHKIKRYLYT